ncbi:hypothetical protein [Microbacterium sp.]
MAVIAMVAFVVLVAVMLGRRLFGSDRERWWRLDRFATANAMTRCPR